MESSGSSRRILVEGLPLKCSNRDLSGHFSEFGPLTECVAMIDRKTGNCRGFGFVSFMWEHHCKVCLQLQSHTIKNAKVTLRLLNNHDIGGFERTLPTRKLLVSYVGKRLRKYDILEYFSKFGSVNVEMGSDGEKPAFFAYVVFNDEEMCRNCTRIAEHFINGHRVFVRSVVRKEVYKRAEQAERERIASEEGFETDKEEKRRVQHFYNSGLLKLSEPTVGLQNQGSSTQFSSFFVPPPPPTYPSLQTEAFLNQVVNSNAYSCTRSTQSSHSWVPLLPVSASNIGSVPNTGSMASIMAGYGGSQVQESLLQRRDEYGTPDSYATRNARDTWARLADLPAAELSSVSGYTASPQYYYKM